MSIARMMHTPFMTMFDQQLKTPAVEAQRALAASALARYTHNRREELGMSVAAAAELAGLQLSEWYALEEGWVPQDLRTLRAIAGALQVRWTDYDFLAFITGFRQQRS